MASFLLLILIGLIGFAGYVADTQFRHFPRLRWAYTGRNYIIQRQTILGAWIPVGKKTFTNSEQAEGWIKKTLDIVSSDNEGKYGPTMKAPIGNE